jgi:hypothetical protein
VITAANREQVRELVPGEFYSYAIENVPELEMRIVAPEDYPPHPKYVEATVLFACQASIDAGGRLVNYKAGQPFPSRSGRRRRPGTAAISAPTIRSSR